MSEQLVRDMGVAIGTLGLVFRPEEEWPRPMPLHDLTEDLDLPPRVRAAVDAYNDSIRSWNAENPA